MRSRFKVRRLTGFLSALLLCLGLLVPLAGCEEKGLGDKIEEGAEEVGDEIDDAL